MFVERTALLFKNISRFRFQRSNKSFNFNVASSEITWAILTSQRAFFLENSGLIDSSLTPKTTCSYLVKKPSGQWDVSYGYPDLHNNSDFIKKGCFL